MTLHIDCRYCPVFDLFEVKISNLMDFETMWHDWTSLPSLIALFRGDDDSLPINTVTINADRLSRFRAAEYLEMKLEEAREMQQK